MKCIVGFNMNHFSMFPKLDGVSIFIAQRAVCIGTKLHEECKGLVLKDL